MSVRQVKPTGANAAGTNSSATGDVGARTNSSATDKSGMGTAMNGGPLNPNLARDHLANERTLLAWTRTGIAIVGLGFVVARFGLLLRELSGKTIPPPAERSSTQIGVALVIAGAFAVVLSALRYTRTAQDIERNIYRWSPWLPLLLAGSLVLISILLAVYLLTVA